MGFVSNQWLNRGMGIRKRSYRPVAVAVSCKEASDAWSRRNDVAIEFTARKAGGEYQTLHLSPAEVDKVAAAIVGRMSEEARKALTPSLLRGLSDAEFLKVLASDLRKRTAG
jgi:hypothetical protein